MTARNPLQSHMHHLGLTRSANHRDHLLHTPDTFVRTPLPGLTNALAIVHVSPQTGAAFSMMTLEFCPGGRISSGPAQRFVYVLDGHLQIEYSSSEAARELRAGDFAYFPAGQTYSLTSTVASRVVAIDKPFEPLDQHAATAISDSKESSEPWFLTGRESDVASCALEGDEALQVRALLPSSMAFDFACNTMSYQPGASLSQVEVHYMEHGLLMLEGGGIYRLNDQWYPVQAGDFIWMAPFCPQWFCAVGKQPAKYLIYKNFNRHTLI